MKNVMASAAEAEMGALFVNGQEVMVLRNILAEMGHPQPPTPIRTDNSTSTTSLTTPSHREDQDQRIWGSIR